LSARLARNAGRRAASIISGAVRGFFVRSSGAAFEHAEPSQSNGLSLRETYGDQAHHL
jgi:hypothetical protein